MLTKIKINSKFMYLIGLGFQPHYDIIQKNIDQFKSQQSFWVYDKAKLDIAYFISRQKHTIQDNKITYITRQNYQTVQLIQKPFQKQIKYNDIILNIIKNTQFIRKNTFCDISPLQAYNMICKYTNIKVKNQIRQLFKLSFSAHQLSNIKPFLPKLIQIRKQYLNDSGLKLRTLQRLKSATPQQFQQIVKIWKRHYQINEIESKLSGKVTESQWKDKIDWIAQNKFGFQVKKQYIAENYGRKFMYADIY